MREPTTVSLIEYARTCSSSEDRSMFDLFADRLQEQAEEIERLKEHPVMECEECKNETFCHICARCFICEEKMREDTILKQRNQLASKDKLIGEAVIILATIADIQSFQSIEFDKCKSADFKEVVEHAKEIQTKLKEASDE